MSRTSPRILLLYIPPTDPLRRIYHLAISRSGTLDSPAGRSFDPSAEGAMAIARPPLLLLISPCLSLQSTGYRLSPCCHTLRRCSLTVKTLCLRRGEWDHDPPAVTTRNLTHVQLFNFDFARPIITQIVFHVICNQIQFSCCMDSIFCSILFYYV